MRYFQHFTTGGSKWTQLYPPIKLLTSFPACSFFDEDKYTKEYMCKYGIDNVRGGSYTSVNLTREQKKLLQKEIWAANNKCLKCGQAGHFYKRCPLRYQKKGAKIQLIERQILQAIKDSQKQDKKDENPQEDVAPAVPATKQTGSKKEQGQGQSQGQDYYEYGKTKKGAKGKIKELEKKWKPFCRRCFREGHTRENCYAKMNLVGKYIGWKH